jgi:PIN domain nuclease of toxin-antitoxin system
VRLLLDTSTFLWFITDAAALSRTIRAAIVDPENEVFLSAASTWEIAVKHALGRLPLPEAPERFVPTMRERHGIEALALDEESTLTLTRLPPVHKDPFDRMLVCQALTHGLVIATPDEDIRRYPVRTAWE